MPIRGKEQGRSVSTTIAASSLQTSVRVENFNGKTIDGRLIVLQFKLY
jgi:hypothetical protein